MYVSFSFMPTMLEFGPMPTRSEGTTLCFSALLNFGSSVSAKSIFSVLAGASRQCALWAASTSPDSASATSQERAVMFLGRAGAPVPRAAWVPRIPSRSPPTVDIRAGGMPDGDTRGEGVWGEGLGEEGVGEEGVWAARTGAAVSVRDDRVAEVTRRDRLVFLMAGTIEKVPGPASDVLPSSSTRSFIRSFSGPPVLHPVLHPAAGTEPPKAILDT